MKITSRSAGRAALPGHRYVAVLLLTTALCWYSARTKAGGPPDPAALARAAVSTDPAVARSAIAALRGQGPTGLQTLFTVYDADIRRRTTLPAPAPDDPHWQRTAAALDAVGRQKDCYASRLYWYTDLAEAEKAARASGKPILSLRLLGKLDEELSCANSRFFRTALYPNAATSAYLRTHYVLHWQSVRPVPTFTLDFGDGRKIVRTLTGNSIHYVLDAKGRPVDALPGLYGPQAFLRHLTEDEGIARRSASLTDDAAQTAYVREWHRAQFDALAVRWTEDGAKAFPQARVPTLASLVAPVGNPRPKPGEPPSAVAAGVLAASKAVVEMPVVQALLPSATGTFGPAPLDSAWDRIAQLRVGDALLDANSWALMASKHPDISRVPTAPVMAPPRGLTVVGTISVPFRIDPSAPTPGPMDRLVTNFERFMAQDTAHNEYVFHAKLHQWFAAGEVTGGVEALNRRVYSDLFLTPDADPYLGLAPAGAYTALPNDGLVVAAPRRPGSSTGIQSAGL